MSFRLGNRIIIIGNSGSGKTTLSYSLGELLNLPIVHLDKEYWKEGWIGTPKEEWKKKVKSLVSDSEWIMDGNFGSSLEIRLHRADTIIFLDYNRFICLLSVLKRWRTYLGKTRPDMTEGCPEKIDFDFLRWILWTFPKKLRMNITKNISLHKNKVIIVINNRKKLKHFLAAIGLTE
jgi:adenylate kinase family enzyme